MKLWALLQFRLYITNCTTYNTVLSVHILILVKNECLNIKYIYSHDSHDEMKKKKNKKRMKKSNDFPEMISLPFR